MGFNNSNFELRTAFHAGAVDVKGAAFGQGTGPIHLGDVECTGAELRIADCPATANPTCQHVQDAGVRCKPGNKDNTHASYTVEPQNPL